MTGGVLLGSSISSSAGPDWTDVVLMMTELGVLHKVFVRLEMCPDGGVGAAALQIVAIAEKRRAIDTEVPRSVSRRHKFPNATTRTMAAAAYRLLLELDRDCSKMWEQTELDIV